MKKTGMPREIRKLHQSFQNALRGLALCIFHERNFRVHMVAAFYVTVFALLGGANAQQAAIFCSCFGLTMGAELMNTAVERLCDRQASGYDGTVRNAKDIAAAAVFVCALACAGIGVILFVFDGLLQQAFAVLLRHVWIFAPLAASIPAALLFIFKFGRKQ